MVSLTWYTPICQVSSLNLVIDLGEWIGHKQFMTTIKVLKCILKMVPSPQSPVKYMAQKWGLLSAKEAAASVGHTQGI